MLGRRALACVALLVMIGGLTAADTPNYYPTNVGLKWSYRVSGEANLIYLVASKQEKLGDQVCTRMELKIDLLSAAGENVGVLTSGAFLPVARTRFVAVSAEHVAQMKDGVYRIMVDGNLIGPPVNFLKFGVAKDDAWSCAFKIKEKPGKISYRADFEEVEVPAGKFKNALRITGQTIENGVITRIDSWYVADVGMVKQIQVNGKDETILELVKLEQLQLEEKK